MAGSIRRPRFKVSSNPRVRHVLLLAVLALTVVSGGAILAAAAVPTFPDNILIFPNRDFITVQGYTNQAGKTATVEITRAGKVIGSAQAVVSGGDIAFDINHPGGVCWGNGTSLQVTPDIKPGDTATIKFGGVAAGDTTVQDAQVAFDGVHYVEGSATVTYTGSAKLDAGIPVGNLEQRTVNADLVALIGKRDVRAILGPLTPAATGGYSSGLDITGTTFTATYVFDDPAVAATVAHGGGERLLSWQTLDGAGNRQGVTIAERDQLGGPGFGGCPAGPAQQVPPTPRSVSVIRPASAKTTMQVDWAAVTAQPGADPVDGYSVELIASTKTAAGQAQQGIRTTDAVTKATFTGLDPAETYSVEVRSTAAGHMSDPGVSSPLPDTAAPTINDPSPAGGAGAATATTAPNGVTLSGTGQIYYTLDSSSPINGDVPSDTAKLYAAPIPVTGPTEIRAIALDQAGNHSREIQAFYKVADATTPPAADVPAAPVGVSAAGGAHQAKVQWTAGPASVTGYKIYAYKAGETVASSTTPASATATSVTVTGLTAGATYTFGVKASNASGDSAETRSNDVAVTDSVSITKVTWKVGDFRVTGTGTDAVTPAGTVTLYNAATNAAISPDTAVVAAVAPATGTTFDLRLRTGSATTAAGKPAKIYAKSSLGGRSADVVVP